MDACRIVVTCREVKGHCAAGQQAGDKATFDGMHFEGRLCIHSLASMMSKIFAMHQGVDFGWLENPDVSTHACPDAGNPVVYEVRRERFTAVADSGGE